MRTVAAYICTMSPADGTPAGGPPPGSPTMDTRSEVDSFAALLRRHRRAAALTQEELAAQAGISREAISSLERGFRRFPRRETVELLGVALGLSGPEQSALWQAARRRVPRQLAVPAAPAAPETVQVPAQLPARRPLLLGREAELERMSAPLLAKPPQPVVVTGPPGVGKTALAVACGQRHAQDFPDGQVIINLQGARRDQALGPVDAVSRVLQALGVPAHEVPAQLGSATAMLNQALAERRILLVLDDVREYEQVEALVDSAPYAAILITSRRVMQRAVLSADAYHVHLGPLQTGAAVALLSRYFSPQTVGSTVLSELAEVCGNYPLALKLAAACLAGTSGPDLSAHVEALRRLGAHHLTVDGSRLLRDLFATAVSELGAEDRQALVLTAAIPGRTTPTYALAAALDRQVEQVTLSLNRLRSISLLEAADYERVTVHDLIRNLALQPELWDLPAVAHDDSLVQAVATVADWYITQVWSASHQGYAGHGHPDAALNPSVGPSLAHGSAAEARHWLDLECESIADLVTELHRRGDHRRAWLLADVTLARDWHTGSADLWRRLRRTGLAASRADRNADAEVRLLAHEAIALMYAGDHRESLRVAESGARLVPLLSGSDPAFTAWFTLSWCQRQIGDLPGAEHSVRQAAEVAGDRRCVMEASLCLVLLGLGRLKEAIDAGEASLRERESPQDRAETHINVADAYLRLGDTSAARDHLTSASACLEEATDPYTVGGLLDMRARLLLRSGDIDAARASAREACQILGGLLRGDAQAMGLVTLAEVERSMGNARSGRKLALGSLKSLHEGGWVADEPRALLTLARCELDLGQLAAAARSARAGIEVCNRSGYVVEHRALMDLRARAEQATDSAGRP